MGRTILAVIPLVFLNVAGCSFAVFSTSIENGREIKSPAPQRAISPRVGAMRDGSVVLTWLEPIDDKLATLRASFWRGGVWSAPRTIVEAQPFSRHPSESPAIVALSEVNLIAYWPQKPPGGKSGSKEVDVYFSVSTDRGLHWSAPTLANNPGTGAESSYPSMVATDVTHASIMWLDGSDWGKHRRVSLMSRVVSSDGSATEPAVLDPDTCTCCPTSLARTDYGVVGAYRGHTPEDVRDISLVQNIAGHWSDPHIAYADNWHFRGCPVNGPKLDAHGSTVALIWFTAPQEPEVRFAFSHDGGAHFTLPIRINEGHAIGRAQVVLISNHSALAFWLESRPGTVRLLGRRVVEGKTLETSFEVARGTGLGYPHAVRSGKNAIITWAEESPVSQIHVAIVSASESTD